MKETNWSQVSGPPSVHRFSCKIARHATEVQSAYRNVLCCESTVLTLRNSAGCSKSVNWWAGPKTCTQEAFWLAFYQQTHVSWSRNREPHWVDWCSLWYLDFQLLFHSQRFLCCASRETNLEKPYWSFCTDVQVLQAALMPDLFSSVPFFDLDKLRDMWFFCVPSLWIALSSMELYGIFCRRAHEGGLGMALCRYSDPESERAGCDPSSNVLWWDYQQSVSYVFLNRLLLARFVRFSHVVCRIFRNVYDISVTVQSSNLVTLKHLHRLQCLYSKSWSLANRCIQMQTCQFSSTDVCLSLQPPFLTRPCESGSQV